MEKRILGRTGIEAGVIGFGCEGFDGKSTEECNEMIDLALDNGVNYFDMYTSDPEIRKHVGDALKRYPREKYFVQGHVCTIWEGGQYCRVREIGKVKAGFEDLLKTMSLDYVDVGMIHYVDTDDDYSKVMGGEVIAYCLQMKQDGKIRHVGMSTHNTDVALKAAKSGLIDVIMFSVNPAYDMLPPIDEVELLFEDGTFDREYNGIDDRRAELYTCCQNEGVAITVMKAFAGGLLLDGNQSPFGKAMTPTQCISYCLTRPAVDVVMSGMANVDEIKQSLAYVNATEREKDYASVLGSAPKSTFKGHCMYCGHCAPCSVKIDVASVNKYLDLSQSQGFVPETVREHYNSLEHHANECLQCGKCMKNCPFGVNIIEKMQAAATLFGK